MDDIRRLTSYFTSHPAGQVLRLSLTVTLSRVLVNLISLLVLVVQVVAVALSPLHDHQQKDQEGKLIEGCSEKSGN
jgi:hypothetical protein